MCETVIDWFRSYLRRSQIVRYGECLSNKLDVTSGIAQGTVLGPLMFIFYMNDCVKLLDNVHVTMFADECVLYYTGNNWNNIYGTIQGDLDIFVNWCIKNGLRLNARKTQAMVVDTINRLSKLVNLEPFTLQGSPIKYVKQYNYLGVILDSEMSLIPVCKNIEKRVIDKIYMLRKLRKYLTQHAALQIYKQLILPIFYYAGFLLIACTRDKKRDLQVIQNDVLRFYNNNKREDKVLLNVMHKNANLISLEQRRCKQILSLMYKLSKNPENRKIGNRNTRQQEKYIFKTDSKIGTKYSNSPYYKGTKMWDTPVMMSNFLTILMFLKACYKISLKFLTKTILLK